MTGSNVELAATLACIHQETGKVRLKSSSTQRIGCNGFRIQRFLVSVFVRFAVISRTGSARTVCGCAAGVEV
ncbi:hypothetical protein ZHAS_00006563 [Anopheles sinensis]|uniref:Uncharacterized protein n=1 Tax=Anopheles sinensis TaxID=74873 RepID=A0A084VMM7_ANOSI|nr:hypothetical protein ZHAS_00006563 [Anopheles sinensis]